MSNVCNAWQNGAFHVQTNDPICIYFEDELPFFEEDGSRKDRNIFSGADNVGDLYAYQEHFWNDVKDWVKESKLKKQMQGNGPQNSSEKLRMVYHERENGNYPATTSDGKFVGKTQIARQVMFGMVCNV
jgi:hypothetical protein